MKIDKKLIKELVDNLKEFERSITQLKDAKVWSKNQIVELFFKIIPNFNYDDLGEYLDGKM